MTLTIEIEDVKKKSLEEIAAAKGKNVNEVVKDVLDDYLRRDAAEKQETNNLMKLSETSFDEWNNEEDAVYDRL